MVYLYFIIAAALSFAVSVFFTVCIIKLFAEKIGPEKTEALLFVPSTFVVSVAFPLINFLTTNIKDKLFVASPVFIGLVLIVAVLIGFCGINKKSDKYSPLVLAFACTVCSFLLPANFELYDLNMSPFMQRIVSAIIWFLFSSAYLALKKEDALMSVYTIFLGFFIFVLYLLSMVSMEQMLFAGVLIGILGGLALFDTPPDKLNLTNSSALSLGFLSGYVVLGCSAEGIWASMQIMSVYPYILLMFLLLGKINFVWEGRAEHTILLSQRVMIVSAALAFMQIYIEVSSVLFILTIIFVLWTMSKIGMDNKRKNIKEINKEFVQNIKENIQNVRNLWGKKQ